MRFMMIVRDGNTEPKGVPPVGLLQGIGALGQEAGQAGVLVATGGLAPATSGARVRLSGGKIAAQKSLSPVMPEPAAYAIYELPSIDEAMDWAERFMRLYQQHWPGWEGDIEIRQIFGQG